MHGNYWYVDGESHYWMSDRCWKTIHGEEADLSRLRPNPNAQLPNPVGVDMSQRMWMHPDAKFFFDVSLMGLAFDSQQRVYDRKVYFTSFTGAQAGLHAARVRIREAGFEPEVILEEKDLAKRRTNQLKENSLLTKAKGVDIGLAVRMLEDAYHNNFQRCVLLTSDIDYLPVIEAVRRMGKQVFVLGYREGISQDSPFLYVPDLFVDIGEEFMRRNYLLKE
jgi:hypothetical protein